MEDYLKKFLRQSVIVGAVIVVTLIFASRDLAAYGGGDGGGDGGGGGSTSLGLDWLSDSGGRYETAGGSIDLGNLPDPPPRTPQELREYEMRIAHRKSFMFDIASAAGQSALVTVAFTPLGLKIKVAISAGVAAGQASSSTSAVGSGTLAGGLEVFTRNMNPIAGLIVSDVVTQTVNHSLNNGSKAPTQNIGTLEMKNRSVDTGTRTGMPPSGVSVFK